MSPETDDNKRWEDRCGSRVKVYVGARSDETANVVMLSELELSLAEAPRVEAPLSSMKSLMIMRLTQRRKREMKSLVQKPNGGGPESVVRLGGNGNESFSVSQEL